MSLASGMFCQTSSSHWNTSQYLCSGCNSLWQEAFRRQPATVSARRISSFVPPTLFMFSWGPDKTTFLIIFVQTRACQSAKYLWISHPIFFFSYPPNQSSVCPGCRTERWRHGEADWAQSAGGKPNISSDTNRGLGFISPAPQLMKWPKRQLIRRKTFGSNLTDDLLLFDGIQGGRV